MVTDPLTLAVRAYATWCDQACRLHRFAPQGDARVWWSSRRSPDLFPDAVTLVPDLPVLDVVGRIFDGPGASVRDSYATLDLSDQGWHVDRADTWVVRAPGAGSAEIASAFSVVREKLVFAAWCRASGTPEGTLPAGLRRAAGVTVLGRGGDAGFTDGVIVHRTVVGGTPVAGLWHAFGDWADAAAAAGQRHPEAWLVGLEPGGRLAVAFPAGFTDVGPSRLWRR